MQNNIEHFKRRLTDKLEDNTYSEIINFEDNSEDHVNEKWLISYADMMTLLFGLFVMLYTIAMETQGHPEKVFADIVSGRNSLNDMENQIATINKELAEKIKSLKSLTVENNQIKGLVLQLQDQLQQVKEQQGVRMPSGNASDLAKETDLLKSTINKNQQEIGGLKSKINALTENLTSLNLKIEGFSAENEKIKNENLSLKAEVKTNNFMIVVLNWNESQHDIDLKVTDPLGRMFDFQNRTYKESKAKFIVDSRTGPGVEMWETPQIEKGDYTVEFNFYNAYGNNEPAVMTGSVITKKGVFDIKPVTLDFIKNKKKLFKIKTSDAGGVTILPL